MVLFCKSEINIADIKLATCRALYRKWIYVLDVSNLLIKLYMGPKIV